MGASQDSIPAVASVPAKLTVSEALYQPFESGARPGVAVVCGAVASYLSPNDVAPVFPARSWQLPTTAASALSGPEYVFCASHEATPAVASVPAKPTETDALYQPFALGPARRSRRRLRRRGVVLER